MFRFVKATAAAAVALSAVCLASAPASAHPIAIDTQGAWTWLGSPYCNPCQLTTTFNLDTSSGGTTNQIDVYSNGQVSIGGALSSVPDILSIYDDTSPGAAAMLAQYRFTATEDDIFFWVPNGGNPAAVALQLTAVAGNPGAFSATWAFDFNEPPYQPSTPSNPLNGYQYGSNSNYDIQNYNSFGEQYAFFGTPAPEPSTWVEMIAGLLGLGALLRRRGPAAVTA